MTFPVDFHVLGRTIPSHPVFETLGYVCGFQTYLFLRRRTHDRTISDEIAIWIIVGCVFGALVGSKLLAWVESAREYWAMRSYPASWLGGKTIVGGLLGGWIGVELMKRRLRVNVRTGDLFVYPLILGIAIGRIGCFLTGLPDHTYGTHSTLPWAVDFGDGPRHPTQLYESIFLLLLGTVLLLTSRIGHNGVLFRKFMLGYLGFRLLIEFIKPSDKPLLGLSAIQTACVLGIIACIIGLMRIRQSVSVDSAL
jgi:phosphatidylglycerol---prolipoprotein diacylglyceryl transferase